MRWSPSEKCCSCCWKRLGDFNAGPSELGGRGGNLPTYKNLARNISKTFSFERTWIITPPWIFRPTYGPAIVFCAMCGGGGGSGGFLQDPKQEWILGGVRGAILYSKAPSILWSTYDYASKMTKRQVFACWFDTPYAYACWASKTFKDLIR